MFKFKVLMIKIIIIIDKKKEVVIINIIYKTQYNLKEEEQSW